MSRTTTASDIVIGHLGASNCWAIGVLGEDLAGRSRWYWVMTEVYEYVWCQIIAKLICGFEFSQILKFRFYVSTECSAEVNESKQ